MFSGIDFLLKRTMSSFFNAIKNLLTAYHIDKSSTGKIIEPSFKIATVEATFLIVVLLSNTINIKALPAVKLVIKLLIVLSKIGRAHV